MINIQTYKNKHIAILGLGKTGLSAAQALHKSGAIIYTWDDHQGKRDEAKKQNIPLVNLYEVNWKNIDTLLLSPGIPHTYPFPHPLTKVAQDNHVQIICDIELLIQNQPHATYIAITGTNGKSTTTALIGHILKYAGLKVAVGGNIGHPVLDLPALEEDGFYVLELSSYQLELIKTLKFNIAILLNITPDHLERHGNMEGYIAAKKRIFSGQHHNDFAIIGLDDAFCTKIYAQLQHDSQQKLLAISNINNPTCDVFVDDGMLIHKVSNNRKPILNLKELSRLPGQHNWQNIAAAYSTCIPLGLSTKQICDGIKSFPGLPHRQELITTIDHVRFINDSKATNADATAKALCCYNNIYWIVGGKPKETGLQGLDVYYPNILHAFLIGEAEEDFSKVLEGKLPFTLCHTLDHAVNFASKMAFKEKSDINILLSPACASFDQFANFEERGDIFRQLVLNLQKEHTR
ncbi:MAG: UDP-N-acetylmuramoyl-L-alanine--D-glutamate ligase [Alphaproteobacteria bacterium]|nr:UDP-N-acetylmuramoyl-L-alanine--D-glutamate ligase [Alphaproteobacteria bacterium]